MSPAASPRWCPTPEQLMILEEMYRAGVQSPSASLIQQITAHLSRYGKIEGKNVFYWFQNHKARDKQKLKRKFAKQQLQQLFRQQMSPSCSFCHGCQLDHHQCPSSMVVEGPLVPSASALRQLCYYSSPPPPPPSMSYPLQGGNTDGGASRSITDLTSFWRREIIRDHDPQSAGMEKNMMKMYDEVRNTAMGMDSSSELHPAKPLKTLELFPTTSSNLRGDRCKSASTVDQV